MFDLLLKNANIITPCFTINNGFVGINNEMITYVGEEVEYLKDNNNFIGKREYDLNGKYLVPGFFDIHTHGGAGIAYDQLDSIEKLEDISLLSVSEGVTSYLPTLSIASITEKFDQFLSRLSKMAVLVDKNSKGARPLGLNLELFMSPEIGSFSGIEGSEKVLPKPNLENWEKIKSTIDKDIIKIVTVAPEWDDGLKLIRALKMDGIVPSIGHTLADENTLDEAIRRGGSLVTHILNTTYQPEQDQLGVVVPGVNEYLLTRDDIMSELIIDQAGAHVHPTMIKIALKCLGIENIITITDAIHTRGTEIKEYEANGLTYTCDGDVNRKPNGHLSGSANGMNKVVSGLIKHAGVSINEAVRTATENPARLLNIYDLKGSIEVGKDADLVVVDENINVFMTLVGGEIKYNSSNN